MKKSLIVGVFALAGATASFGQGQIWLDNFFEPGSHLVTYGAAGIPANGVSGASGTVGTGLQTGWTAGFYFAAGDITGSVAADPSGIALPSDLNASFVLATGAGSTAAFNNFGLPGAFTSGANFTSGLAIGSTITVEIIAYSGSDYASATYRGHSTAFTMVLSDPSGAVSRVGDVMPTFSVSHVPEPSTFALTGMGTLALLLFRRRK